MSEDNSEGESGRLEIEGHQYTQINDVIYHIKVLRANEPTKCRLYKLESNLIKSNLKNELGVNLKYVGIEDDFQNAISLLLSSNQALEIILVDEKGGIQCALGRPTVLKFSGPFLAGMSKDRPGTRSQPASEPPQDILQLYIPLHILSNKQAYPPLVPLINSYIKEVREVYGDGVKCSIIVTHGAGPQEPVTMELATRWSALDKDNGDVQLLKKLADYVLVDTNVFSHSLGNIVQWALHAATVFGLQRFKLFKSGDELLRMVRGHLNERIKSREP